MNEYLKPQQVAARLQISSRMVYKLIEAGTIPVIRIGRVVRVPADALDRWLVDHTQESVAA
jgi:excisionase family DNA binding protein